MENNITFKAFIKGYKQVNGSRVLIFNAGDKLDEEGNPIEKTLLFPETLNIYIKPLIGVLSYIKAECDDKGIWSVKRIFDKSDIATINFITSQQKKA